ncbi:Protein argonaute [Escovopsis weberi]|uniref:Protein argonaute n=1 Tax=Escovopsis weberi TaxID=150374 RepID=A0A0M8N0X4_ESCWE|nr:Protein argonaute [Escovopsis weberi]
MLAIKRNFYKYGNKGRPLMDGGIVEVHKGIYASLRLSHNMRFGGQGLALNIDVANTCFWVGQRSMDEMMVQFLGTLDRRWRGLTPLSVAQLLRPVQGPNGVWQSSDAFKQLRKLRKLRFTVRHLNRKNPEKLFTVMDFTFSENFGAEGANAKNVTFEYEGRTLSVADYYRLKYKVHLRYSHLPLIETGKAGRIPMELAFVEPMQRYPLKLNPDQTASMIKISVTRPTQRKADIMKNVGDLQLDSDPYLKHYGIQFDTSFAKTEARILPPPPVHFGRGTADPKFSGRWDLRGKKFFKQNVAPLESWAFIVMNDCRRVG